MYHLQKNGLFDAWFLTTLIFADEVPSKDMIYLNLHECSWGKLAN